MKDFGYATDNAGWTKSDRPILLWSPDSKKIATFQHDGRKVGEMYLVDTRVGHPKLQAWKYPLPGDEHIFTIQRVIIELNARRAGGCARADFRRIRPFRSQFRHNEFIRPRRSRLR